MLILTAMASFMVALDQLVVATALDTIRRDLGASLAQLEWTVNAYGLTFAVLLMPAASLGDRFGRRRTFVGGLIAFVAASAACALAPDAGWLIAARAAQGVGSAFVMPSAFALLSAAVPAERRGRALGIFSAVTGVAVLGGPVIGGAVAQGLDWEWIFWINLPFGLVVVPLALARVAESLGARTRLDLPGIALASGTAFGLLWGLQRGNSVGWGSAEVLGTLAAGLVLGCAFVAWELRTPRPMLPMRLFARRGFAAGSASALLLYASLFSAVFLLAQFLQVGLGYGPLRAGVALGAWTGTLFFVAPVAGALVDRGLARPLLVGGLLCQAAGMALIGLLADPGMPYWQLVPGFVVAGVGVSLAMPAVQSVILASVEPADVGRASGTYNTMRQFGGTLGIAVVVATFAGAGGYGSAADFADGFAPAMGVIAALSLGGAVAGLVLPRRGRAPAPALAVAEAVR